MQQPAPEHRAAVVSLSQKNSDEDLIPHVVIAFQLDMVW